MDGWKAKRRRRRIDEGRGGEFSLTYSFRQIFFPPSPSPSISLTTSDRQNDRRAAQKELRGSSSLHLYEHCCPPLSLSGHLMAWGRGRKKIDRQEKSFFALTFKFCELCLSAVGASKATTMARRATTALLHRIEGKERGDRWDRFLPPFMRIRHGRSRQTDSVRNQPPLIQ